MQAPKRVHHKDKQPDDVVCVVEVRASYETANPSAVKFHERLKKASWLRRLFMRPDIDYVSIGSSQARNETFALDYSAIRPVLDKLAELREDAQDHLDRARKDGWEFTSRIEAQAWIGRRDQFEPRPADRSKLWVLRGNNNPPLSLTGAEITKPALRKALKPFFTAEKQRRAESLRQAFIKRAVHESTVAQEPVRISRPLKISGTKP